jgi:transcriptional regulator with XRE-family HTH domain
MNPEDISPIERGKRLKYLRELTELSREKFAKIAGCGKSTLQFWEEGKANGFPEEQAEHFISLFKKAGIVCSIDWLLSNIGMTPILAKDFVNRDQPAQENLLINDKVIKEAEAFHIRHEKAISLIMADDSMLPFYYPGDLIGGQKHYGEGINALLHQRCIIELPNAELVCRILKSSSKNDRYDLIGTNISSTAKNFIYFEVKVLSAASVIWHYHPSSF